jgi:hypothetical protein
MGGGGSINYTMIHESNKWLTKHLGHNEAYWQTLKEELNGKFHCGNPFDIETEFSQHIQEKAKQATPNPYEAASPQHLTGNITSYQDDWENCPTPEAKQLYIFPTQFNTFGQRTNSGVSLVPWEDSRVDLRVLREVKELELVKQSNSREGDDDSGDATSTSTCVAVKVKNLESNTMETYSLSKEGGKVVLCGGSASPRLLMRKRDYFLNNGEAIGKHVNDHICMPLGFYIVPQESEVGPKDNYQSLFATMVSHPNEEDEGKKEDVVCTFDFFSGSADRLVYLASSLYLAFLPFNGFKRWMGEHPPAFTLLSNSVRVILRGLIFIIQVVLGVWDVIRFKQWGTTTLTITTSLVKFNAAQEGQYEEGKNDPITLGFFKDEQDKRVAEKVIKDNLAFLESIGSKPPFVLRKIFQFITKIPYEEEEVRRYVEHFSKKTLLSEQHLAGGCLFGEVVDSGENDPSQTGKVFGSENVYVADLSTVPLPRVSTQMTAYLIGHYVGKQLYANDQEK